MGDVRPPSGLRKSIAIALGTANLRRLQLAWGASAVGGWVFFVALSVYAYDEGGTTAVGAAALVRMVPAGLAAPLTGLLADRHSRRDVMLGALGLRAVLALAMAATVAADAPLALVLVLAAASTVCAAAHKPAQAGLLLELADTPAQAGAANALWTGIDNGAFLAGSLLGGVLVSTAGSDVAFAAVSVIYLLATVPLLLIAADPVPVYRAPVSGTGSLRALRDGFVHVAREREVRDVVGFLTAATFVEGIIDVLVVVVALDMLDLGSGGVGWLNAAW